MSGGKGVIYWDSCIFLTYIQNESRQDPNDLVGAIELFNLFDMGQLEIATSSITLIEVLETRITSEQYIKFKNFRIRRNFHIMDVTIKIAELSADIRCQYRQSDSATLAVPDCIHIATAIAFPCESLYTFDGTGQRPGILTYAGAIASQYNLQIQKPIPTHPPQLEFNL